jgi:hypothetical protein
VLSPTTYRRALNLVASVPCATEDLILSPNGLSGTTSGQLLYECVALRSFGPHRRACAVS